MSSPITDPRERAMAENTVPAPPPAAHHETPKLFDKDYQYAENLQNPFPEVIFSPVPNPVPGDGDHHTTAASTAHSTPRPGTAGSTKDMPPIREHVWVEPADPPWYTAISRRKWIAIIICTVGITGAMVAVLAAMGKFSGGRSEDSDTTSTTTPVTTVTVSSPADDKTSFPSTHSQLTPVPSASADASTTDPSTTASTSASGTAGSTNPSSTVS